MVAVIEAPVHSQVTGAGGTAVVAVTPGGTAVGKTLCALVTWRGIGIVTPVEAGWTEHYDFPDTVGSQLAFYSRPAVDPEASSYTFNFSGAASRVVATLFFVSNHIALETFSAEASGNTLTPTSPTPTSAGPDRLALRVWNKTHTNNMTVPSDLDIVLRWNTGGSDAGACGHVATADPVNAGVVAAKVCQLDTFAREWRSVVVLISPGTKVLSHTDTNMQRLSAYTGSVADRERQRLLALLGLTEPQPLSMMDLYKLVPEDKPRIWGY